MKMQLQFGFTLFETLVAVFIIAVGVLCTAKMQHAIAKTAHHSSFHATAVQIGSSIADSLRANSRSTGSSPYMDALLASDHGRLMAGKPMDQETEKAASIDCYQFACTAAQLAQADIEAWQERIRAELPDGQLRVCRDAQPWDEGKKAYRWDCASAENAASASLVVKIGWRTRSEDMQSLPQAVPELSIVMTVAPYPQ